MITAIILAGGHGLRMKGLDGPKPLVLINGKPMLAYLLDHLKTYVSNAVVCYGPHRSDMLEFISTYSCTRMWSIQPSNAGEDASMTDRIREAIQYCNGPALICYGDHIANVNVDELMKVHKAQGKDMTCTIVPFKSEFGIFDFSGKKPVFTEKPIVRDHFVNIGFILIEQIALKDIRGEESVADLLQAALKQDRLGFYKHLGMSVTVNTPKELRDAERQLS